MKTFDGASRVMYQVQYSEEHTDGWVPVDSNVFPVMKDAIRHAKECEPVLSRECRVAVLYPVKFDD